MAIYKILFQSNYKMNPVVHDNRIGIMSVVHEGKRPFGMQTYFFEDMVKNAGLKEERYFFFSPLNWIKGEMQINGFRFINKKWIEVNETIPKIIYDRAFSKDTYQKKYIEKFRSFLDTSNFHILNPFKLADLLNDKVAFHNFMQNHNIATLDTFLFLIYQAIIIWMF